MKKRSETFRTIDRGLRRSRSGPARIIEPRARQIQVEGGAFRGTRRHAAAPSWCYPRRPEQLLRILQQLDDLGEGEGGGGAVDDSMIAREAEGEQLADADHAAIDDDAVLRAPDGEDADFGVIDDRVAKRSAWLPTLLIVKVLPMSCSRGMLRLRAISAVIAIATDFEHAEPIRIAGSRGP